MLISPRLAASANIGANRSVTSCGAPSKLATETVAPLGLTPSRLAMFGACGAAGSGACATSLLSTQPERSAKHAKARQVLGRQRAASASPEEVSPDRNF